MRQFDELLQEAVAFHGHLCPGQVLGIRMAVAGCRALQIDEPKAMGKGLVVFVEIDRCATDAIQAVTGCSLGKRTLKHMDYGKMAATFVNVPAGEAVRVAARDDARARQRLRARHGRPAAGPTGGLPGDAGGRASAPETGDHPARVAGPEPGAGLLPALRRGSELRPRGSDGSAHPLPAVLCRRLLRLAEWHP